MEEKEKILKRLLCVPCETKEDLHRWIRVYLNIDLPDCIVTEESNSSPMDLIWEVYDKARKNKDENFSRVMAYAGRGGFKTLGASILEILTILHLKRNVGHMAATKDQSERSQEYVRDFTNKQYIKDFKVGDSKKRIEFLRYEHKQTQESISDAEYSVLTDSQKGEYERISNFIQIVICSLQGANGLHAEMFCVDEIDTIDGERIRGYKESKNIPKARNGFMPVTLLTSTRKFSYGLVQKELDKANKTGLHVRHWNVIDVLEKCSPQRHRPEEPKVNLYINDDTLEVLNEANYKFLDPQTQEKFVRQEAYAGCVTCPIFSACKTRLVSHQKSTSEMLSPIPEIAEKFKDQSVEDIQTQLLCRKPSSAGLIYPRFNKNIHFKTANEIYNMCFDEDFPSKLSKHELLKILVENGARFYSGIDFGFTHPFCVVTGAVWGNFCFIVDVISQPNLELDDKIAICQKLKKYNPTVFADPEDPASIETFAKKGGFRVRRWKKDAGSVKRGIEVVRAKLKPAYGDPSLFLLKDDPGCELLATRIESYHFETDLTGEVSEEPAKIDDDELDAMRYMVMNAFVKKGGVVVSAEGEDSNAQPSQQQKNKRPSETTDIQDQMRSIISGFLDKSDYEEIQEKEQTSQTSKFFWDL